ncbi:hypothetical protein E2F46_07170 [Luteimonas aestuarii]|uniref:PH domain-containing protein n=1 Tax=Luteimonas aestuarii TaxID=453837 RepID=A0A4R5TV68_9GAMM|nr:STM3941 family protein [Luteimonas aestuarii]TDK24952.1 hypothetical protein E2F46_07170 [Luteimonas aestuarii]
MIDAGGVGADADALHLKPSRWRLLLLLAGSLGFVALGVLLVREGEAWVAWSCIVFFGLCALVAIVSLLPGAGGLWLDAQGFKVRSLYRTWSVRWQDVAGFHPARIGPNRMVCWDYAPGYRPQQRIRRFSRGVAGAEAALPESYGMQVDALAVLLERWRLRHAQHGVDAGDSRGIQ